MGNGTTVGEQGHDVVPNCQICGLLHLSTCESGYTSLEYSSLLSEPTFSFQSQMVQVDHGPDSSPYIIILTFPPEYKYLGKIHVAKT
jgi:hypothetical protein